MITTTDIPASPAWSLPAFLKDNRVVVAIIATTALGAIAVPAVLVFPPTSSVSLCAYNYETGKCSATSAVRGDKVDKPNNAYKIRMVVRTGWLDGAGSAVVRLYDRHEQKAYCTLDIESGAGEHQYDLEGCIGEDTLHEDFMAPMLFLDDTTTHYTLNVAYGSVYDGTHGRIGTTTFTYKD